MHNNFYFLKHLSSTLKQKVIGCKLAECFSQGKNELILSFVCEEKELYIKAHLQPNFSCLSFPKSFSRAHKNTANLFEELIQIKVIDVIQFSHERSFSLRFENGFSLVFKLFGNRSNIILFKDEENVKRFKNNLSQDRTLDYHSLSRTLKQDLQEFKDKNANYKILFPTFGKVVNEFIDKRISETTTIESQWKLISTVEQQLNDAKSFYILEKEGKPILSLLDVGEVIFETDNPIEAINFFFTAYTKDYYLQREKQAIEKQLELKYNKTNAYIKKVESKLTEMHSGLSYDKIADIIMANMHQIPNRASSVELFDFYNDNQIKIKLNKALSPQKNAENYYRKSKNQKIELDSLQKNLQNKIKSKSSIKKHLEAIQNLETLKDLRKYLKENSLLENTEASEKTLLFKTFEIDGWQILIGKNAKNNDLLTQKFSFKEDLWLHAKDVSGSHVLIKYRSGHKYPKWMIEKAAQLAAYYSQRKTDTLCPVIVTPKKFVRKPKGAAPGTVIIDKEEVLLVKPESFRDL